MGRIFNIYFQHAGHSYTALVTLAGKKAEEKISISAYGGNIQIIFPNGRLLFPISEVLHRVTTTAIRGREESFMRLTNSISLQLINTSW